MKKPLSPGEALNKAAAYCTLCERCTSEASAKLTAWGVPSGEQEKIIARLIDDILSTGATPTSCATAIQQDCNCRISVFTLAYTYNKI